MRENYSANYKICKCGKKIKFNVMKGKFTPCKCKPRIKPPESVYGDTYGHNPVPSLAMYSKKNCK